MGFLQAAADQDFWEEHSTKPFNPASGLKCSAWAECLDWDRATAIKPDT
jgi:hypothetical protein